LEGKLVTMKLQPKHGMGASELREPWNCSPPVHIIHFGISFRGALRHDLPLRYRCLSSAMTRSIDQTMDLDESGAPEFRPQMGDDDRKRRGEGGLPGAPGSAVITKTRPQVKRPNMYRVLLLNDDYTPMEFVVDVLQRFFNKDRDAATRIMLHVHHHGIGECGVYTYEVAETKVTQVMDFARKHQHPLQCVMEKK
jgi:ATP-dependent Clp protease adaptor protein ClpS